MTIFIESKGRDREGGEKQERQEVEERKEDYGRRTGSEESEKEREVL